MRATEAAARLLRNNYETLGSWPLAIVAYNHGHAGIQAASAAVGSNAIEDIVARYTGPRFGFASKNFYAEFLAALDVVHPLLGGRGKATAQHAAGVASSPAAAGWCHRPAGTSPRSRGGRGGSGNRGARSAHACPADGGVVRIRSAPH
jgi:hypothetical protein